MVYLNKVGCDNNNNMIIAIMAKIVYDFIIYLIK